MDKVKSEAIFEKLKNNPVGAWTVVEFINHGKSAAVFRATDGSKNVALKIFDDELIEKYGDHTQLARIERELTLIGKHHDNMVSIIDGGFDNITNNHFIVMDFLDGKNIKDSLKDVPAKNIPSLIAQLASAAKFLEDNDLVHRDIKPENIILLNDYAKLVLLDFGVLRPIGKPGLTDDDGIQPFVGTLQYSSPEFLLRQEVDDVDGWRALTYYQIGGVMHDLIMGRELFAEFSVPYSRLVNAVQHEIPLIQNSGVDSSMIDLARCCLLKDPQKRLKMLDWHSFELPSDDLSPQESAKVRVTNRAILKRAESLTPLKVPPVSDAQVVNEVVEFLKDTARLLGADNTAFPKIDVVFRPKHRDDVILRLRSNELDNLPLELTIQLSIQVVDASARAVAINAAAHWGKACSTPCSGQTALFKGLFDSAAMRTAFEDCVYELIDVAQAAGNAIDGDWVAPADEQGTAE